MIRITRVTTFANEGAGSAQRVWQTVARQPSWITRVAMLAFFIIIGLPIMFLLLIALLVAIVLFGSLALVNAVWIRLRSVFASRDDGRENVRVIRRT